MFYLVLLVLILLIGVTGVLVFQNFMTLLTSSVHLTFISWHLPGIPVLLLCLLGAFLGGLLLYVFSSFSARYDTREIKKLNVRTRELRERIEELEQPQIKPPSGSLSMNFPPPVVRIPGFSPSGPLQQRQPPSNPLPNLSPSGPLQQRQPPTGGQPNLPPPPGQLPPLPQTGGPRPPFLR